MAEILYKELSYKLVGIAMEIHETLGPGFLEKSYQKAYELELSANEISFCAQKKIKIEYKNIDLGFQILDLVVDDSIIIELKAVSELLPIHEAQLLSYLKATKYELGILVNFGAKSLEYKRLVVSNQY